ncbi:MAG TPA: GNAT family protein [Desulfobacteria bacterium]|nr:GNAT family protein [Desulfobacteria bacterium]
MKLVGEKVVVRNLTRADVPMLVKWKNDPEIADLVRGAPINTTFEIESRRFARGIDDHDTLRLIIETLTGKPIGFISLGDIDRDSHKAEVGMLIGEKEFWDRGFGTEGLKLLIKYLFYEMDFNRIGLEVFEYNTRAKKAYQKIGFKVEGLLRQALFRKNKYYDIFIMGILKQDFTEQ